MEIWITTRSENTAARLGVLAEWGLSILVELNGHKVLLDTGLTISAAYNAIALGIDLFASCHSGGAKQPKNLAQGKLREVTELKPDPLRDDRAVFIRSDRRLIVILGCAHRGVVNTLSYAQKLTGVEAIYAVIGGMHLMAASLERMDLTIADLRKPDVQRLGICHCTGLPASAILAGEFGDSFFFNNAGTRVSL